MEPGTSYEVTVQYRGAVGFRDAETTGTFTTGGLARNVVSVTRRGAPSEVGPKGGDFLVARSGVTTDPLRVQFRLGGAARDGVDYQSPGTSVLIPAGVKSASVPIVPLPDDLDEGPEDVTLTLLPGPGYELARTGTSAALIILDPVRLMGAKSFTLKDGSIPRWNFAKAQLAAAKPEHWYRIQVDKPIKLNVTVTGPYINSDQAYVTEDKQRILARRLAALNADVGLELLDADGNRIGDGSDQPATSSATGMLSPPESLGREALPGAGYYYLRVYLSGASQSGFRGAAPYLLMLSGGDNWDLIAGTVPFGASPAGEVHHVGVFRTPGTAAAATDSDPRWIVTHGRDSQPGKFLNIAKELKKLQPAAEVMLLDWSTAADSFGPVGFNNGFWFPEIGTRLGALLAKRGGADRFKGDQVSMVGHSCGTYVNHEIAGAVHRATGTPVARVVALDPALYAGASYDVDDQRFADHAAYSLGFYSSVLGNSTTARTCTDSFDMNVTGTANPITRHNLAHVAFLTMLADKDAISKEFRGVLFDAKAPIWLSPRDEEALNKRLHYTGTLLDDSPLLSPSDGFEGKMSVASVGGRWRAWEMFFHSR